VGWGGIGDGRRGRGAVVVREGLASCGAVGNAYPGLIRDIEGARGGEE
jgi:hypothetical protein